MNQRVVIGGASGLIGKALTASFQSDGIRVVRLVRRAAQNDDELQWLNDNKPLDPQVLSGALAVINLGGASIGSFPWSRNYRRKLRLSRLKPTRTIADAVRALGADAPQFVSASAVGFYGNRPGEQLDEGSSCGDSFLARLCVDWESAGLLAGRDARVCLLRTAPVLHPTGMLKPMMLLTKLGLGGPLGTGRQHMPWISLEDEVRAIRHVIAQRLSGPVNLAGPTVSSANDLGMALADELKRPFFVPAPAFGLRFLLGSKAANSLLLADAAVIPARLLETGFEFKHNTVKQAIKAALN